MSNFNKAFNALMIWEGGYINDANDKGGETKFGISKRSYPNLCIKTLTEQDAREIYYQDYWLKANCHTIEHDKTAQRLFLAAVNCGVSRAVKIFQECINLANLSEKITVDGIPGRRTTAAFCKISEACPELFAESFTCCLIRYYNEIVEKNKSQAVFFRGWVRRALH